MVTILLSFKGIDAKNIAIKREYLILKLLSTAGFLTVFALQAWADTPALTRDDIRRLAYDGDHATLEVRLVNERDESLEGKKDFSILRDLMYAFEASDPRMVSFIETWVNAQPTSSYAQTARSLSLSRGAWAIRGEKFAKFVHPQALAVHGRMIEDAISHARLAVALDPDFIPASDAVLNQSATSWNKNEIINVLDAVMQRHPNWESLEKSLGIAHQGYGGSAEMLATLCQTYAPLLAETDVDLNMRCLYAGLTSYYFSDSYDARQAIQSIAEQDPALDYYRANSMTSRHVSHTRSEADIAFIRKVILQQAWLRTSLVTRFDSAFSAGSGKTRLADEIAIVKFDEIKERLKHDPFNTALMGLAAPAITHRVGQHDCG